MFARGRRRKNKGKKVVEPPNEHFTDATIHICKQAFEAFDKDNSGRINREELQDSLRSLGLTMTNEEVHQLMLSVAQRYRPEAEFTEQRPPDNIGFTEFCSVWVASLEETGSEEKLLRTAFNFLDRDRSGALDRGEFESILMVIGDKLSQKEVDLFFSIVDEDDSGTIRYDEFLKLLLCEEPDPEREQGDDHLAEVARGDPGNEPFATDEESYIASRKFLDSVHGTLYPRGDARHLTFKAEEAEPLEGIPNPDKPEDGSSGTKTFFDAAQRVRRQVEVVMHLGGDRYLTRGMAMRLTEAGFRVDAADLQGGAQELDKLKEESVDRLRRLSLSKSTSAGLDNPVKPEHPVSIYGNAKVHPEADHASQIEQNATTLPGAPSHVSPRVESPPGGS